MVEGGEGVKPGEPEDGVAEPRVQLRDLRGSYRRIQVVFEGDAPAAPLRVPGVVAVRRAGRVLSVLASGSADGVIDAARALAPLSVDSAPVSLKEIFLETVGSER